MTNESQPPQSPDTTAGHLGSKLIELLLDGGAVVTAEIDGKVVEIRRVRPLPDEPVEDQNRIV